MQKLTILASLSFALLCTNTAWPQAEQVTYIKRSPTQLTGALGSAIAVDEDWLITGALTSYRRPSASANWVIHPYPVPPTGSGPVGFGFSVDVDGDRMVVGAPGASLTDIVFERTGLAYVYQWTGTEWILEQTLTASNAENDDGFGRSVAISGNRIAIAATGEDSLSDGIDGDQFNDPVLRSVEVGAVYLFELASNWTQTHYIKASNSAGDDWFGYSLDLAGDLLAVGSPFQDGGAYGINGDQSDYSRPSSGAVYTFDLSGPVPVQEAYVKPAASDGDYFGWSVSLLGQALLVGSPWESALLTGIDGQGGPPQFGINALLAGAAFLFERTDGVWSEELFVKPTIPHPFQEFGESVCLLGPDSFVVGAPRESVEGFFEEPQPLTGLPERDWGAAHVYAREDGVWTQSAYLKPEFPDAFDAFATTLAGDGDRLFLGAPGEDSDAVGIDGDASNNLSTNSGAIYEFDLDGPEASVTVRTMGSNVQSYSATPPQLGTTWQATVDLSSTGHALAYCLFFLEPTQLGPILGDQWVLVGATFPAGELFALPPLVGSPDATLSVPIPELPSLYGIELHTQAAHVGGTVPLALSNALRLVLGN